jgi:cytochrome P450
VAFFRSLPEFRRDPLNHFWQAAMKYGEVVRYRSLWSAYQLSHPDHIQQVLQSNFANYRKGRDYHILRLSLGNGLLNSEGARWQRQRKMTQPAFQSQQVASFMRIMSGHTMALLQRWEVFAAQGRVFDVVPELMGLTLSIVSQALFTANLESDAAAIQEMLAVGREYSVDRAWSVVRVPVAVPTRRNREYRKSISAFHQIIDRIIAERRNTSDRPPDLLTMLMEARDEEGIAMSDRQLRDEVATLVTAGHETTTLVLAWTCFLIATHPEVMERMAAEAAFVNAEAPAYEDLAKLKYSRNVLIFPYITHRHPRWWPEPESFRPERFAPENSASRPRYAYLPFGAGPRTCVGLHFAMTEILLVMALLLQRFRLELAMDPATVRVEPSVTLRPNPGVLVKLHRAVNPAG